MSGERPTAPPAPEAPASPAPSRREPSPDAGGPPNVPAASRAAFETYRLRQAMRLLDLLPDGALRPLYARAREWADDRGIHRPEDPLATLRAYCRELLPLPPYRAWVADVVRNPGPYADVLGPAPEGEDLREEPEPVTVDVRGVRHRGRSWYASLNLVPDARGWSGFISFSPGEAAASPPSTSYRTADVFREETAEAVRERFADFDEAALGAFLRSVLP